MELHWQFTKIPGLTFQFEGDDDLWAFINNKLALDIGGIHGTTTDSLNVDTLGLTERESIPFRSILLRTTCHWFRYPNNHQYHYGKTYDSFTHACSARYQCNCRG